MRKLIGHALLALVLTAATLVTVLLAAMAWGEGNRWRATWLLAMAVMTAVILWVQVIARNDAAVGGQNPPGI